MMDPIYFFLFAAFLLHPKFEEDLQVVPARAPQQFQPRWIRQI